MQFYQEDELVFQLKSKNQKAFSYLYDNYAPAVYGVICKTLKSKEASEDCLQEVFVKVWNNIEGYQPDRGRLFTWLSSITRNHVIDTLRSKNYKETASTLEHTEFSEKNRPVTALYDTLGIWKFVGRLREDHQNIVRLFYHSGHTQQEISNMLCIPVGTVKTKMRQAISSLKLAVQ